MEPSLSMVQSPSLSAQSAFRVGLGIDNYKQYSLLLSSILRAILSLPVVFVVRFTDVKKKDYQIRSPTSPVDHVPAPPGDHLCQNFGWFRGIHWHCGMVAEAPAPAPACGLPDPQGGGNRQSSCDRGVPFRQIREADSKWHPGRVASPQRRCRRLFRVSCAQRWPRGDC